MDLLGLVLSMQYFLLSSSCSENTNVMNGHSPYPTSPSHEGHTNHEHYFDKSSHEVQLRNHLFGNYSPDLLPLRNEYQVLNVTFNMKLIRLLYVEEKTQKLGSQAYYSMKWKNDFLRWDPEHWGNIKYLAVEPDIVYKPDIILKNNADFKAVTIQKNTDKVWLKYNGKSSWYPKVMITCSFNADIRDFPFDRQEFVFHFGSWSLGEDRLHIHKDDKPMLDRHYLNDTEWKLIDTHKETVRTQYDSDAYREIKFTYYVARKPTYIVITAILPSVGLMSLALFSYILPPRHGERIKVILTSLLAFTVFIVEINGYLPRNSDSLPTIQLFYMVTMAECMLCFIATCFIVRLFDNAPKGTVPCYVPIWVQKYLFGMKDKKIRASPIEKLIRKHEILPQNVPATPVLGRINLLQPYESSINVQQTARVRRTCTIEMNRVQFLECVDTLCLKIFTMLYFCTTFFILVPAYCRNL